MNSRILNVWLNDKLVGELVQEAGEMTFTYANDTPMSISLSMPLRQEPYLHKECFPYFDGLLPEGDKTRQAIAKRFKISSSNAFSMLSAIGSDCAGAISFHEPGHRPSNNFPEKLQFCMITDTELAQHIRELPQRPLFVDVEGIRLSLAGAQEKAAVCLIEGKIVLPINGAPTTHILKPAILGYQDTVKNEYLCMRIAQNVGIPVAEVKLGQAEDREYLLISRYDRKILPEGLISRVHQEDFCQALGVKSSIKYQSDGGPGFRQCFELLKQTTIPALDINRFVELIVFNFLVGNMDAHAKNFSLLHRSAEEIAIAPLYDALCTTVYPQLSNKMAMKIGGRYKLNDVYVPHWEEWCLENHFSFPELVRIMDSFTKKISSATQAELMELTSAGHDVQLVKQVAERIDKHCKITRQRFSFS